MGSIEDAICVGFICRLCSKPQKNVIFIFGRHGYELDLIRKINSYLPIEVSEYDELPKTICESCLEKIIQHHQLIERIQQVQQRFLVMREESLRLMNTEGEHELPPDLGQRSRTVSVDSTERGDEPAPALAEAQAENVVALWADAHAVAVANGGEEREPDSSNAQVAGTSAARRSRMSNVSNERQSTVNKRRTLKRRNASGNLAERSMGPAKKRYTQPRVGAKARTPVSKRRSKRIQKMRGTGVSKK